MSRNDQPLRESPSQTAGPFVHIGLTPNFLGLDGIYDADLGATMVGDGASGDRIVVTGRVFDGANAVVKDAMIEIWQADAAGLYNSPAEIRGPADPNFSGWGRCPTGFEDGVYRFETLKPGRVPLIWPIKRHRPASPQEPRLQAPHINFWIVARGINVGLQTRLYFSDESAANGEDPLLSKLGQRAATLIASREEIADQVPVYRFDIHLQGENETAFFDI